MIPIHAAAIRQKEYLFLRKVQDNLFQWFLVTPSFQKEEETAFIAETLPLALSQGGKVWKEDSFRLLHCGFRYNLPDRDLVGVNALFWQMVKSYNSFNGHYFDEEVGHMCYVDFASQEALELWRKIR